MLPPRPDATFIEAVIAAAEKLLEAWGHEAGLEEPIGNLREVCDRAKKVLALKTEDKS